MVSVFIEIERPNASAQAIIGRYNYIKIKGFLF
ncbi:hypothetical protein J2Z58_003698 [Halobacillus andaensis]|nr:hypothetical protein [Halobacillus andaensis]